jgi:hypothetical protein
MMGSMREDRPRLRIVGAAAAALLLMLVALSPTLLFGESLSAFGLILIGGSLLSVGALLRWAGGAYGRTLGTILVIVGGVILALGVALLALLLAGRGWAPF